MAQILIIRRFQDIADHFCATHLMEAANRFISNRQQLDGYFPAFSKNKGPS